MSAVAGVNPRPPQASWRAQLDLGFRRREESTILSRNLHVGPLQVQKALYPEGRDTCHVVVLHPPGGIAAGDELCVQAGMTAGARALLTTPGAAKWYRSTGAQATQRIRFELDDDSTLEWLPRETILFDESRAAMHLDIDLSEDARYVGWEVLCFGRRAAGERWTAGSLQLATHVRRSGRVLWSEHGHIEAHDAFMSSSAGLRGASVCGTMIVAAGEVDRAVLGRCREVRPGHARASVGLTQLPSLLIARYLGDASQDAFAWFTDLWRVLRPAVLGRAARTPRIWAC